MSLTLTGSELAGIILAVATLVAAVSAAISAWRANASVAAVGKAVNGQTTHLVALTAASSYAAGAIAAASGQTAPLPGVQGVVGAPAPDPTHGGDPPHVL